MDDIKWRNDSFIIVKMKINGERLTFKSYNRKDFALFICTIIRVIMRAT